MGRAYDTAEADAYLDGLLADAEKLLAPHSIPSAPGEDEDIEAWLGRLATEGLEVDGKPFRLDNRPALRGIYDAVPKSSDEAYGYILVLQKSAQVGFTVMEMLVGIYIALKFGPATIGMFMPDQQSAETKSRERLLPIVKSMPSVHDLMRDPQTGRLNEGSRHERRIGANRFVTRWATGRTSTESTPMDVVLLDEVQEISLEAIEKIYERMSASEVRFLLMGSTANWPDDDINYWYRRGSQYRFHTRCPTCHAMAPLDEYFPQCIRREGRETFYVCRQGHRIKDTQDGEWRPDHPELEPAFDPSIPKEQRALRIRSFHYPQTISPTISARQLLDAWDNATSQKSFYNRKLGMPFVDPTQVPVTIDHLNACVAAGIEAGVTWKSRDRGTFMGIDQMGGFNVVWIKKRRADGRDQVVHVEEIYSLEPFMRCSELMEQYGVVCCVVEINPNYNDARLFALEFPGKVFLCDSFGELDDGMMLWSDHARTRSERRTSDEALDRCTVRIDQPKCMQSSMARFVEAKCLIFEPLSVVQTVTDKGREHTTPILPRAFTHFTKTAIVIEKDEKKGTNQYKRVVKKIGIDPHHSYANLLCDVAMARSHGEIQMLWPVGPHEAPDAEASGLPSQVLQWQAEIQEVRQGCQTCSAYPVDQNGEAPLSGHCPRRNFTTHPTDPICDLFEPIH